jgi:hypothetical protein
MILNIPISEAVDLIKTKTGKVVNLRVVNSNTVNVDYELKIRVPIWGDITKNVSLDISIEKIIGKTVYLQYSASGVGIDLILRGFFAALPTFSSLRVVEALDTCRLKINLDEIIEVRKALEQIRVNNVSFNKNNAIVDFSLI